MVSIHSPRPLKVWEHVFSSTLDVPHTRWPWLGNSCIPRVWRAFSFDKFLNFVVVWAFFCIAFLWNWNENWPSPVINSKDLYLVFMFACRNISGVSLLHSIFSFNLAINLKNPPGKILICLCVFSRMCIKFSLMISTNTKIVLFSLLMWFSTEMLNQPYIPEANHLSYKDLYY